MPLLFLMKRDWVHHHYQYRHPSVQVQRGALRGVHASTIQAQLSVMCSIQCQDQLCDAFCYTEGGNLEAGVQTYIGVACIQYVRTIPLYVPAQEAWCPLLISLWVHDDEQPFTGGTACHAE